MFRPVTRTILRQAQSATRQSTRFSSTSSAKKPCSLKSTVLRYAAVGGILYYYSTSAVFAQEPKFVEKHPPTLQPEDERPASLIDEILSSKDTKTEVAQTTPTKAVESAIEDTIDVPAEQEGGIGALEEEAGQQGAFNPETGEINWDCPCLGGMAHGPCGEDFKTAFSCFVYSTAEPKGADCIEKFKNMQTCFQQHPEIYGGELDDEEEEGDSALSEAAISATEPATEAPKEPKVEEPAQPTNTTAAVVEDVPVAPAVEAGEPVVGGPSGETKV